MRLRLLLLLIIPFCANAGTGYITGGAAQSGMSNASVTQQDIWSLFHNPAGIAGIKSLQFGISSEQRYSLKELTTHALVFGMPAGKDGAFGLNAAYSGFSSFNEQHAGLTYARNFGNRIQAGVQLIYHNVTIGNEYGNSSMLTFDAGMMASLTSKLWLGSHIYNPLRPELASSTGEKLPSVFSLGAGYRFSEKFNASIQAEKTSGDKAFARCGIEYHPVKSLWLRAGITSIPWSSSFGFGVLFNNIQFDFSAAFHQQLGFTPTAGLTYRLPEKK